MKPYRFFRMQMVHGLTGPKATCSVLQNWLENVCFWSSHLATVWLTPGATKWKPSFASGTVSSILILKVALCFYHLVAKTRKDNAIILNELTFKRWISKPLDQLDCLNLSLLKKVSVHPFFRCVMLFYPSFSNDGFPPSKALFAGNNYRV